MTDNIYAVQKLHRARELNVKGEYELAQDTAKAVAFDALRTQDFDLMRLAYMRLASLEDDEKLQADYFVGAVQASTYVPDVYINTCMQVVNMMLIMPTEKVLYLCQRLAVAVQGEFYQFLVALSAKLSGHDYSTLEIPHILVVKLSQFRVKK